MGRQTLYTVANQSAATLTRGGCTVCTDEVTAIERVFNGGVLQYLLNDTAANKAARVRNDYNLTNLYQAPRDVRFGARFTF